MAKDTTTKGEEKAERAISVPLEDLKTLATEETTEKFTERAARGFILGTTKMADNRKIQQNLENKVVKKIGKKGKLLTDKLFELIEGVYIVDKRQDGKTFKYYQVPPDLKAIIYALDRVLGKPVAHTAHTEERRGVIIVENIIKNLADPNNATKKSNRDTEAIPAEFEPREGNDV